MKKLLAISLMLLLSAISASAQNIRLGERVPDIDARTLTGEQLNNLKTSHVCLIFTHFDSAPANEALVELFDIIANHDDLTLVLLTPQGYQDVTELPELPLRKDVIIAYDNNRHTLQAYGISYVPFVVIYDTKRCHARWFGSIHSLDDKTLDRVITPKNNR